MESYSVCLRSLECLNGSYCVICSPKNCAFFFHLLCFHLCDQIQTCITRFCTIFSNDYFVANNSRTSYKVTKKITIKMKIFLHPRSVSEKSPYATSTAFATPCMISNDTKRLIFPLIFDAFQFMTPKNFKLKRTFLMNAIFFCGKKHDCLEILP